MSSIAADECSSKHPREKPERPEENANTTKRPRGVKEESNDASPEPVCSSSSSSGSSTSGRVAAQNTGIVEDAGTTVKMEASEAARENSKGSNTRSAVILRPDAISSTTIEQESVKEESSEGQALDLFDWDVEMRKLEEDPSVDRYSHQPQKILYERARKSPYYYKNEATLMAAVELNNREKCVLVKSEDKWAPPNLLEWRKDGHLGHWQRQPIMKHGSHRNPCAECNMGFNTFEMRYEKYHFEVLKFDRNGWQYDRKKLCTGCFGRRVHLLYGTDMVAIKKRLIEKRQEQKENLKAKPPIKGAKIAEYEDDYFNRAWRRQHDEDLFRNCFPHDTTTSSLKKYMKEREAEFVSELAEDKDGWWLCQY